MKIKIVLCLLAQVFGVGLLTGFLCWGLEEPCTVSPHPSKEQLEEWVALKKRLTSPAFKSALEGLNTQLEESRKRIEAIGARKD